jgi:hypothetical protein
MPVHIYENGIVVFSEVPKTDHLKGLAKDNGNKEKTYQITRKHYKHITSATILLFEKAKYKPTFWTFTIPEGQYTFDEKEAVKRFATFIDNFKKTYGLNLYIWVMERQQNGVPHWHMIADAPFLSIPALRTAYNRALGIESDCSVRLPRDGAVINSIGAITRYVAWYVTKARKSASPEKPFKARCWAMSRELTKTRHELSREDIKTLGDHFEAQGYTYHINKEYNFTVGIPEKRLEENRNFVRKTIEKYSRNANFTENTE